MPTTYEKIATTTLGSAATSIDFTSIGSTYTDLRVILVVAGVSSQAAPGIRFNSDSGTNYSITELRGTGSAAGSGRNTSQNKMGFSDFFGAFETTPSMWTADVFSYAGSTNKTVLLTGGTDNNGSGGVTRSVGLWRSTSAITSISLFIDGTTTFSTGTTATLYGILKA
jgi:hypothetical protein